MQTIDRQAMEECHEEVGFTSRNVSHADCTSLLAGRFAEALSEARRATGILELLVNGDPEAFAAQLAHSGYARIHFLKRCAKESFADYHTSASHSEGLFDALAAGQLGIAREIAALSQKAFRPNEEYEDDFCYAHFLHGYIGPTPPAQGKVLKQFGKALEGDASARLAICHAFESVDAAAFDQAFDALLDEHDEHVAELRLGRAEEEVAVAAGTYVFVEGLALLWLAERAGFDTKADYRYCPALARAAIGSAPPPDELPPV